MNISAPEAPGRQASVDATAFAAFAELLPEATLLVDGAGFVLSANRAAAKLLACRAVDLVDRPLASMTREDARRVGELIRIGSRSPQPTLGALCFALNGGSDVPARCELTLVRPRDAEQPALVSLRLTNRHPMIDRFVLLNHRIYELSSEITHRRVAEQQLAAHREQLIEAARRKDEFLAMLAHELRNPLAPMVLGVQLLRTIEPRHAKLDSVAAMMNRHLGHMTRLIDDLLDVARLTHGKIELDPKPVELDAVLERSVEMIAPAAERRGVRLCLDKSDGRRVIVADATRLVQVFGNLLSNAVKFSQAGDEIAVTLENRSDGVAVSVSDRGAGIAPELLPTIFDLFVQGDSSLDRTQGGLGVGLSIVRTIVQLHGGKVTARSDGIGHGTEITVWLPLSEGAERQGQPEAAMVDAKALSATDSLLKLRVLVVEDNADTAEALREILVDWGHDASSAGDGAVALKLWPDWQPDVALLDIGLPGMTGHQLARRIRQLPGQKTLLMLALSGYGSPADRQASRDAGFDDHLTKPVDLDRLETMLAAHAALLRGAGTG